MKARSQASATTARDWLNQLRDNVFRAAPAATQLHLGLNIATKVADIATRTPSRTLTRQQVERFNKYSTETTGQRTLVSADTQVIVVSHQPTCLPYLGVYGLFCLAAALAQHITRHERRKVAIVYLALDTDDYMDRRIKTAHLASVNAQAGSLTLSMPGDRALRNVPQFTVSAPSNAIVRMWENRIRSAYDSLVPKSTINAKCDLLRVLIPGQTSNASVWAAQLLREFTRRILGVSASTIQLSAILPVIAPHIGDLVAVWPELRAAHIESRSRARADGVQLKYVSHDLRYPLWGVCGTCQQRLPVIKFHSHEALILAQCNRCGAAESSGNLESVLPRVHIEDLIPSEVLGARIVLTYAGGAEHILRSVDAWNRLSGASLPIYAWQPRITVVTAMLETVRRLNSTGLDNRTTAASRLLTSGRESLVGVLAESTSTRLGDELQRTMREVGLITATEIRVSEYE